MPSQEKFQLVLALQPLQDRILVRKTQLHRCAGIVTGAQKRLIKICRRWNGKKNNNPDACSVSRSADAWAFGNCTIIKCQSFHILASPVNSVMHVSHTTTDDNEWAWTWAWVHGSIPLVQRSNSPCHIHLSRCILDKGGIQKALSVPSSWLWLSSVLPASLCTEFKLPLQIKVMAQLDSKPNSYITRQKAELGIRPGSTEQIDWWGAAQWSLLQLAI